MAQLIFKHVVKQFLSKEYRRLIRDIAYVLQDILYIVPVVMLAGYRSNQFSLAVGYRIVTQCTVSYYKVRLWQTKMVLQVFLK